MESPEITFFLMLFCMCFFAIPIKISKNEPIDGGQILNVYKKYKHNLSTTKNSTGNNGNITEYTTRNYDEEIFLNFTNDKFFRKYLKPRKLPTTFLMDTHNNPLYNMSNIRHMASYYDLPKKFDWRDYKIITKVRKQGGCGSCYAQSVIATIESMVTLHARLRTPIELSIQQMLECARNITAGCLGGDTCGLLNWLKAENVRILPDIIYPKIQGNQTCKAKPLIRKMQSTVYTARVINYSCSDFSGKEYKVIGLLARYGPVSATVNANTWKNYAGGIMHNNERCQGPPNHAVQIVGYNLLDPVPHYLVRNSWGTDYGIEGYVKIAIGENVCGIVSEISRIAVEWS